MGWGAGSTFQKVKDVLSAPLNVTSPIKTVYYFYLTQRTFYLTSTDKSISTLLTQEVEGVEHPYITWAGPSEVLSYTTLPSSAITSCSYLPPKSFVTTCLVTRLTWSKNPIHWNIFSFDQPCQDVLSSISFSFISLASPLSRPRD